MSNLQKYKQRIAKNKALAKNILHITSGFAIVLMSQNRRYISQTVFCVVRFHAGNKENLVRKWQSLKRN